MKIFETPLEGLKVLEPRVFEDVRGKFIKIFTDEFFQTSGLEIDIKETYYSISEKNVIRGMHFQTPPFEHLKLVYVPYGKILDVVLDIRKGSATFGKSFSIELTAKNAKVLIIPKGFAHGFKSLEDNTNVTYLQTSVYAPEHDAGLRFDSFGFDWEIEAPKISQRDSDFVAFNGFDSPFEYEPIA